MFDERIKPSAPSGFTPQVQCSGVTWTLRLLSSTLGRKCLKSQRGAGLISPKVLFLSPIPFMERRRHSPLSFGVSPGLKGTDHPSPLELEDEGLMSQEAAESVCKSHASLAHLYPHPHNLMMRAQQQSCSAAPFTTAVTWALITV